MKKYCCIEIIGRQTPLRCWTTKSHVTTAVHIIHTPAYKKHACVVDSSLCVKRRVPISFFFRCQFLSCFFTSLLLPPRMSLSSSTPEGLCQHQRSATFWTSGGNRWCLPFFPPVRAFKLCCSGVGSQHSHLFFFSFQACQFSSSCCCCANKLTYIYALPVSDTSSASMHSGASEPA